MVVEKKFTGSDLIIVVSLYKSDLDLMAEFFSGYLELKHFIKEQKIDHLYVGKIATGNRNLDECYRINYLISLPYELKEIEDQMNQIKRESLQNKKAIKQAEQQRNDLLLYLAHDLKTPLTSIVGYLDLLMNQPNLTIEEKSN